ncbi:hypothetical protein QBC34DRAFT_440501 [Podospora aff. communis PSN243]|uniref:Uncharacterized protein n=1 Tax=Podospora aff. communis PSN243 TaxID=3040156 RepID=A0AAV9GGK9_9PEZI|nr:hypothetical protein QBC34DRAFT_440501 [Podospora aff. communis PSN243]
MSDDSDDYLADSPGAAQPIRLVQKASNDSNKLARREAYDHENRRHQNQMELEAARFRHEKGMKDADVTMAKIKIEAMGHSLFFYFGVVAVVGLGTAFMVAWIRQILS